MKRLFVSISILFSLFSFENSYSGYYALGNPTGGNGTSGNPFQISDAADIDHLMLTTGDWDKYFILTQDINCTGFTWSTNNPSPIGNPSIHFTGNFDGRNYIISNINISKPGETSISFH